MYIVCIRKTLLSKVNLVKILIRRSLMSTRNIIFRTILCAVIEKELELRKFIRNYIAVVNNLLLFASVTDSINNTNIIVD